MKPRRALRTVLLAGAVLAGLAWSPAKAQFPGAYEVKKGDSLYSIGGKFRYQDATRFQVAVAIYRANQDAFPGGNINELRQGQLLRIPNRDEVVAIVPAEASREWQSRIAKPAQPPAEVAALKPAFPAKPAVVTSPTLEAAAKRYQEGLALERQGDHRRALTAFLEAGEAGNGLAQRKLGQIYDQGNAVVPRDYQASLNWYQKARVQGVEIEKPLPRTLPR